MTANPSSENQIAAASTQNGRGSGLSVASGSPLRTAPDRQNEQMHGATGIFLRAIGQDGRWGSYDMAELDAESLTAWLKRDGGDNALAENCVRILLGHPQIQANTASSDRLLASDVFTHFKTYREARERQVILEGRRRKGSFGIAVGKDDEAVEWQSLSRAVETSRAFLESRQPIPECWGERSGVNTKV